jgi:hypothetical protein
MPVPIDLFTRKGKKGYIRSDKILDWAAASWASASEKPLDLVGGDAPTGRGPILQHVAESRRQQAVGDCAWQILPQLVALLLGQRLVDPRRRQVAHRFVPQAVGRSSISRDLDLGCAPAVLEVGDPECVGSACFGRWLHVWGG